MKRHCPSPLLSMAIAMWRPGRERAQIRTGRRRAKRSRVYPSCRRRTGLRVFARLVADGRSRLAIPRAIATTARRAEGRSTTVAGPSWEWPTGSAVWARFAVEPPARSRRIFPCFKLEAASHRGAGQLTGSRRSRGSTTRRRHEGPCGIPGTFLSVPDRPDTAFSRRASGAPSVDRPAAHGTAGRGCT